VIGITLPDLADVVKKNIGSANHSMALWLPPGLGILGAWKPVS
jgi:hypothetical protein